MIAPRGSTGANHFNGSVKSSTRRGLWSRHIVTTDGGTEVIALEPGLGTLSPGDACVLRVDPEDVVVLPSRAGATGG